MIREGDGLARAVAEELMAELKAGKRETIDVDDVIAALEARAEAPPRLSCAFERLLQQSLRRLVEATR
jgi:hypothetical protein